MDAVDKGILFALRTNCRATYQHLGTKLGLTRAAIKKRVDRLIEIGAIQKYSVELSKEMANYDCWWIEILTDGSEGSDSFVKMIGAHPMAFVLNRLSGSRYLVIGHVPGSEGVYDLGRHLRSIDGVISVEMNPLLEVRNRSQGISGQRSVERNPGFNRNEFRILRCLTEDARMPTTEISRRTGISPKVVRRNLNNLQDSGSILFTIYMRTSAFGATSFYLKMCLDDCKNDPMEVTERMELGFSHEYWNSWIVANCSTLIHQFCAKSIQRIEEIADDVRASNVADSIEVLIKYPNRVFQSYGRHRLMELLKENGY
ncbi:MAG: winged helix-turn-helix transcriptional regulator [Candidatus Thorarchaeota archaeon]